MRGAPEDLAFRPAPSRVAFRVFGGPAPADALRRFTSRVGRQPRPLAPWVFGPWYQGSEEQVRALEDMVRDGKVLYPAVSNWSAWQTQRAVDLQEKNNWARLQVIQPMYNLVKRQVEVEILPMAAANGIGVIPYSPAAAGLLSGKYSGEASGRIKTNKQYTARYGEPWVFEVADKVVAFC